jgi:hypothetical protein
MLVDETRWTARHISAGTGSSGSRLQGTTLEGKQSQWIARHNFRRKITVAVDYQSLPQKLQKTVAIDRKVLLSEIHMGSRCTRKCNFVYANKKSANFPALFSRSLYINNSSICRSLIPNFTQIG